MMGVERVLFEHEDEPEQEHDCPSGTETLNLPRAVDG
jgi:hypothetical protein